MLGSSYGGGTGAELGRLVVYLAPWMVASVAVTVTYPLIFVRGRAGWLPVLALGVLVAQVLVDWGLRAAFGLGGVAGGLAVTTALVLFVLLAALGAVRRVVIGRRYCGARMRRARCRSVRTAAPGPRARRGGGGGARPVLRGACALAPGRAAPCVDVPAHVAVACSSCRTLKQIVRWVGRTTVGKNLIHASVLPDPATMRFPNVEQWPAGVHGFEDLAFLFSSNQLNHGVASLQIDEAALLYRLGNAATGPIAEIGRFKGGSTFIFAAAMRDGVELWSYDLHVALRPDMPGPQLDAELRAALERYGLAHKVHLLVADSRTAEPPELPLEVLFIDGDHSYEGARADFERWGEFVRPGGHLLFHDAVDSGGYGNFYPGVAQLMTRGRPGLGPAGGGGLDRPLHPVAVNLIAVVLNWNGGEDTLRGALLRRRSAGHLRRQRLDRRLRPRPSRSVSQTWS